MDDVALAVVTALATQVVDTLAAGGRSAAMALLGTIRSRFVHAPEATVLSAFEARPGDAGARREFAEALVRAMAADSDFAAECSALVGSPVSINHGGAINVIGGHAVRSIQTQSIIGNIRL
jgi:hypothetical protein